uniref:Microtubule-associated protein futsch n=1 Tax=Anopheles minimus TaxID=112268 RepID=A0A182VW38_9DIPT
ERLIQYASENLVTEILIHPQVNTFIQCIRNLLSSFTRHRHIIHTGYTFSGNGSWILQDGTFSVMDFTEAFQEHEVQRVLRAYPDTITMDIHCAPVGQWHTIQEKSFSRLCQVRLNPVDVLSSGSDKLNGFVAYLASMIIPTEISELLESSDVVGNIRFSHPTLYVFPGGQGDAALFGINGFNMLVDGGFSRKSCFWDFVRHLDRLDAVLMTRINNTNIKGISSVVERKSEAHVYPQIGHFFCNIPERKGLPSPDGDKDRDPLLVDILQEGHQIVTNLKSLNLKAQNCYRDVEPINLYHKVGHGTLDMYVISPSRDSREVKDFIARWAAADQRLFTKETKDGKDFAFPLQNLISICALLVWTPANPEDNITRILFPGSAPEYKILEGLEKMKNVEFMRQPVCPVKSITANLSTPVLVTKKSLKSASTDRIISDALHSSKAKDNKLMDNKMRMMAADNKLAADGMDSSADEIKMEKQLSKPPGSTTVASAKMESKPKAIRSGKPMAMSEKKLDNKKLEQQQQDEKKDSISDVSSDKEDVLSTDKSKPLAVDSEKSLDEAPDAQDKKEETDSVKPDLDAKEKKKDDAVSPAGADTGGMVTKATRKPPASRTVTSSTARSKVDTASKASKPSADRKPVMKKQTEANKSSPTTPKKTSSMESKLTNGSATKAEQAEDTKKAVGKASKTGPMIGTKPGKSSPKATPAKSAKDENNRKVLEARQRPTMAAKRDARKELDKKDALPSKQTERKPISRRPKGTVTTSSSAATDGGSPVKARKVLKSEKDAVIRKAKLDKNGTTDSSLVSTPSADEGGVPVSKRPVGVAASDVVPGDSDTLEAIKKQQQLAELKEEQEAVREIEAVFNRDSAAQKALKHRELALTEEHREVQDSATEPEEEEEYLIIEKEEQYTEDSINEPESSATKEEEIQKHQRDSQESEKRKRDSLEEEKEEKVDAVKFVGQTAAAASEVVESEKADDDLPQQEEDAVQASAPAEEELDDQEREMQEKLSPKHKQELEEEVQDIIASAKEIAKSKMETSMDGLKTEEISSISPDEKMSSTKKTSDTRDEEQELPIGHPKDHIDPPHHESHHEERVSATVESGATTTAPTLPEDERIPLDEIKEDLVIEEKHVKEETKEIEVTSSAVAVAAAAAVPTDQPTGPVASTEVITTAAAPLPTVYEPLERPTPTKMQFSAQQAHMRDVVKTPDEVADLPVHEEADLEEDYGEDKDKDSKEDEDKDRDTKEKPEEEPVVAVSTTTVASTMAAIETDAKQLEKTDDERHVVDKSVESDKPCDTANKATEVKEVFEKVEKDTRLDKPPKSDAHETEEQDASKAMLVDDAVLRDLESQIIPVDEKHDSAVQVQQQHQVKQESKTSTEETVAHDDDDEAEKVPVEEELIVAQKVVPKVPQPPQTVTSVLDEIWQSPAKAEEKLDELKHLIEDKAKGTVSELVAIKDTMVKSVAERKEEIVGTVMEEVEDTDRKVKDIIQDAGKEVEQMAVQAAGEIVKDLTDKTDIVLDNLQAKTKQVEDELKANTAKLDAKVDSLVQEASQVATNLDESLTTLAAEKSELEKLAKDLKQDVASQLDTAKQQIEEDIAKEVEKVQDKAKTGISSFFGSITEGIKSGIEKMADKVEHKIKDKTEEVEVKLQQVTEKIDSLQMERESEAASMTQQESAQGYDRFSGPYERSFTQELRETHITTVDSPVTDGDKLSMELKSMVNIPHDIDEDKELEELEANKNLGTFVIEDIKYSAFEDANLREIKEEEEEDRVSPPQGASEKLGPSVGVMPPRARTPEDVAKIVANVAEVLKSDKDLEEIIPGFDPQELERKLSQGAAREEDVGTVQRMLVTASSEDGGEETVICADGSITFSKSATPEPIHGSGTTTPEIKVQEENEEDEEEADKSAEGHGLNFSKDATDIKRTVDEKSSPASSGKSSPDLKTSPTSIEEKDKHELPEKLVQLEKAKPKAQEETAGMLSDIRKESLADHQTDDQIDDTRRESAISTFSERDYTKDESSFVDERDSSRAHSISSHISDLKEDPADLKSVADFLKETDKEHDQVFTDTDDKTKELSSPESITSQKTVSEKEPTSLDALAAAVNSTESSKLIAQESMKQPVAEDTTQEADRHTKQSIEAEAFSRPDSPASVGDDLNQATSLQHDKEKADEGQIIPTRHDLKESASLDLAEEQQQTGDFSRPASPDSAEEISRPASAAEKEQSRPLSAVSGPGDKSPSEKSVDLKPEAKEESRPASAASEPADKAPSEKSVDLKAEAKEDSRPASAATASGPADKAPSEKSVDLKAETKEDSRPASAASGPADKAFSEKSVDLKAETKEESRPASAASGPGDKAPSEKSVDLKAETKEESRPASAASGPADKAPSEKSVDLKVGSKEDSRPASAASGIAGVSMDTDVLASKEPSRPDSVASNKSCTIDSKCGQDTSSITSFAKFEESLSRRESSTRKEEHDGATSDGDEENFETKVCMKETRSKSMSAVVTSVGQRSGFEGSSLGVLEESVIASRDDLDMIRSPRDSVTKLDPPFIPKQSESTLNKSFKPLFGDEPQFPGEKDDVHKQEITNTFPKCGLDSTESPEHGASIAKGMDQLLKDTVTSMKEIEKMTSTVISSTKTEESTIENKTTITSIPGAFPITGDSGKSSPYLGEKSQESSAKSVSPLQDKDSLEESTTSLNTFIEKDSLSEKASNQQQQQVSIRMSTAGESSIETCSTTTEKVTEELLFAGSKTPPTAPISPNVAAKESISITQSHCESSVITSSTSAASATTTLATSAMTTTVPTAPKDDASGISTPKESVPSGKSSPGLMSVHTQGSTDSASKSINLGHSSSGIETSDSSPKPTSPFPKVVVDTLKLADEAKTTSGMSTPDMTRSSTPDMVDSQIERIATTTAGAEKGDSQTTVTTTTTTTKTTTYIIKDGQKIEVDSNVQSDTVSKTETQEPGASTPAGVTSSTTTYVIKDGQKVEVGSSLPGDLSDHTSEVTAAAKASAPTQLTLAGTEERSFNEDYDEKDVLSPRSDISSGQASRIVAGWHDEDVPGSPMSMTSQAPLSPSTKYTYDYDLQHSSSGVSKKSDIEIDQDSQDDIVPPQYGSEEAKTAIPITSSYKPDPMSTSFYGQLPEVPSSMTMTSSTTRSIPIPITGTTKSFAKPYVEYASSGDSSVDSTHKPSMAGDRKYLDEADLDFDKAFSSASSTKMDDLMTTSMHFSSEKEFMAATTTVASMGQSQKMEMDFTSTGLPSSVTTTLTGAQPSATVAQPQPSQPSQPQAQSQSSLSQSTQPTAQPTSTSSAEAKSVLDSWGKPLGLPSPAPMTADDNKTTPKKERRMLMSKTKLNNEKNLRKRAESPTKAKKPSSPVYVDLSYVPHHGNSYYANVEFFKRVRARYYVFSGTEPSREVYNALLEAKQTWEDKELEVTIIPTYDTDVLGYWVSENEELLAKYHIDLSPSAARCTINLQDHETSCSAYRLEF